jgi:hypothetical protein
MASSFLKGALVVFCMVIETWATFISCGFYPMLAAIITEDENPFPLTAWACNFFNGGAPQAQE